LLKVILISFSFKKGGAGIAANNFFSLLNNVSSLQAEVVSQDKAGFFQFILRLISFAIGKLQRDQNLTKHSLNLFSYHGVIEAFKTNPKAIFHLHWINNDTLSIRDFRKIPSGSIITLHDEWLYCGAEHSYKLNDTCLDFESGYQRKKNGVLGIHWNYYIWKKKLKQLQGRRDLIYTAPSTWLLDRAKKSMILKDAEVVLLPNYIDTEVFTPASAFHQQKYRNSLSLEEGDIMVSFGAIDGNRDPLKGIVYLNQALDVLGRRLSESEKNKIKFFSFGGKIKGNSIVNGFTLVSLGYISDKSALALLYSSSDFVVVPSVIESFGQVAAEALACESPVVCFSTSGLTDIVLDDQNGFYADPFSADSLAEKIFQMIRMPKNKRIEFGKNGRAHVESSFSRQVVRDKYLKTIELAFSLKAGLNQ
jgi:glycosyltransferase involved in cell wall biosynthesis